MSDMVFKVGLKVRVTEDVVGYYVKSCGAQMSTTVFKMRVGKVVTLKIHEVEVDFGGFYPIWIPKDKLEKVKDAT